MAEKKTYENSINTTNKTFIFLISLDFKRIKFLGVERESSAINFHQI